MRAVIPIHADVACSDGDAGTSKAVIVDPMQHRMTHIVVREHGLVDSERLVSMDLVDETSEDVIRLRCTHNELHGLDSFIEAHFVNMTYATPPPIGPSYEPNPYPLVASERVPKGEIVLRRSSIVLATDGPIGHVESMIVETANHRITEVVVRTHHFLVREEVAVPVAEVARWFSDGLFLRLSRRDFESLPHVPPHEAELLPALSSVDQDLVPEAPADTGVGNSQPDVSHLEGAHLLAEETGARLRARGFTDDEILDWAKAFLWDQHSGGDVEFLSWIRKQEHARKPLRVHSQSTTTGRK